MKNFAIIIIHKQKKRRPEPSWQKLMNTNDLPGINSYDSQGNNRSIHLHCCSTSLPL